MRVHILGGFLGAGKTTAMRALARYLEARGERVVVVTNDQGYALVDTTLLCREVAVVREIGGGCFCCKYAELETTLLAAEESGATVALAEATGSCTDLVATVLAPLAERHPGRLRIAPLSVFVDPWRVLEMQAGVFPEDVRYLFQKQIEEADVVVISRADLHPPDLSAELRATCPRGAIVRVSGATGEGIAEWLAATSSGTPAALSLDYDRYAAAEALLGWCNGRVRLRSTAPFSPTAVLTRFLEALADVPVAHVKLTGVEPRMGTAALVRRGASPWLDTSGVPPQVREIAWVVNARIALPPEQLSSLVREAMSNAAQPATAEWEEFTCFRPARPIPTCRSGDEASCCAAFYARPDVRYLLGESFHPGGTDLTIEMVAGLGIEHGGRVLDVACGNGASLRALVEAYPVHAVGMDASSPEFREGRLELRRGDAHAIPEKAGSFGAVICECALSTFADQPKALAEMFRVLRPGGRLAISDMVVEGTIPEALAPWVNVGTCLARARSARGYSRLLEDAGFTLLTSWDASDALLDLLSRVKRNLVGAALAKAAGVLPSEVRIDVRTGRTLLREAEAAVRSGAIGYSVLIAERGA